LRGPHNIWRIVRTGATLERTGAMRTVLEAFEAPPQVRLVARILGWPFKPFGLKGDPNLPPVTRALTALGPAYIKFGQILSTRPDVVGGDLARQLRVLQDKLPPFPTATARKVFAREIGRDPDAVFSTFSEPVAAASIAQVHKAQVAETGQWVAVKVLRPGIARAFRRDIDAFYFGAWLLQAVSPGSRRLRPADVVAHFDSVVTNELDLRMEASAAAEFAANTAKDAGFQVPGVVWPLSGREVFTLEWAEGLPMGDPEAIAAAGHDAAAIGNRVLQLFLRHALRDGYFHADMHQGNLKVAGNGDIIVDEYTRRVYAQILIGFIRKDYRRVAEVHFEAGYVPADRDIDAFAQALRSVGEPIFGMDASAISMGRLLAYLFEVTERFGMETRTELLLLQRTMVVVEGVARSLNPRTNMWKVGRPVVEDYIRTSIGPRALARDLRGTLEVLARFGPKLPGLAEAALIRQTNPAPPPTPQRPWRQAVLMALGAALGAGGVAIGLILGG